MHTHAANATKIARRQWVLEIMIVSPEWISGFRRNRFYVDFIALQPR